MDKDEFTPLCIALREQHFEVAKVLIEADADVNTGGKEIFGSALHMAVVRANLEIVDILIKKYAQVNTIDKDGNTPLHFIMNIFSKSETKYRAIAESLVMSDAKPNIRNKEMWAPLHIAARKGMLEAIRWAKMINEILHDLDLEGFDFNAPGGPQKWTMLHLAGYSGHYKVVEEILSAGTTKYPINLFARNGEMKTARNVSKGNMSIAKIIRKAEN